MTAICIPLPLKPARCRLSPWWILICSAPHSIIIILLFPLILHLFLSVFVTGHDGIWRYPDFLMERTNELSRKRKATWPHQTCISTVLFHLPDEMYFPPATPGAQYRLPANRQSVESTALPLTGTTGKCPFDKKVSRMFKEYRLWLVSQLHLYLYKLCRDTTSAEQKEKS